MGIPGLQRRAWLFPATYALHVAEEYWGGFPGWFSRAFDARLSVPDFLAINVVGMTALIVIAAILMGQSAPHPLLALPSTMVLVNGSLHAIMSVVGREYSPGAVTGGFLWVPLGLVGLTQSWMAGPRPQVLVGVLGGLGLQLLAFLSARSL